MGLDMNMYARKEKSKSYDIAYWRKYYKLDSHINNIYCEREGSLEEFNSIPFEISKDDIAEIINLCEEGKELYDEYYHDYTIEALHVALEYIEKGYEIIYCNNY